MKDLKDVLGDTPALRDLELAARLFRMQLALEPEGPPADDARRMLARLGAPASGEAQ